MYALRQSFASPLCLNYWTVNGKVLNLVSTRFTSIIPSWPPIHDPCNSTRCSGLTNTHADYLSPTCTLLEQCSIQSIIKNPIISDDFDSRPLRVHFNNLTLLVCYISKNWSVVVYSPYYLPLYRAHPFKTYMFVVAKCEHLSARSRTTSPFRLKCTFDAN